MEHMIVVGTMKVGTMNSGTLTNCSVCSLNKKYYALSYHHGLFFILAQLCVLPPSFPFVIVHSHHPCYIFIDS